MCFSSSAATDVQLGGKNTKGVIKVNLSQNCKQTAEVNKLFVYILAFTMLWALWKQRNCHIRRL